MGTSPGPATWGEVAACASVSRMPVDRAPLVTPIPARNPRREKLRFVLLGCSGSFGELTRDLLSVSKQVDVTTGGAAAGARAARFPLVVGRWLFSPDLSRPEESGRSRHECARHLNSGFRGGADKQKYSQAQETFYGVTAHPNGSRCDLLSVDETSKPATWKILLAFSIIYFVWGSTFLAIRVGVAEVPPFLLAGMRFVLAGGILYLWARLTGTAPPTGREWRSATLVAILLFVLDYGLLFWAERRVPSGIAAVMMATIPVFMAFSEILFLGTQRLTMRLGVALAVGIAGVGVLVSRTLTDREVPIDLGGAIALVIAAIGWAAGSALTRRLPLPASKPMSSAAQMFSGGVMLTVVSGALGEFRGFDARAVSRGAWLALAYLVVAGSIVAFTAYLWLIHHESPTRVGTYAYVNPVVAVAVGYFLGGEAVGPRTLIGTMLVLVSVIVITTASSKKPAVTAPAVLQKRSRAAT